MNPSAPKPVAASSDRSEVEPSTWISSQRVVLGGDSQSLRVEPACIQLRGNQIARVTQALALAPGDVHIDYGDKLVAPAFINAHTHLALGFLRGADISSAIRGNMVEAFFFEIEKRMTPADVRAFARMGAYESLLAGVGLVWDHYYEAHQIAGALQEVGLAGVVAPTLQDLSGPGVAHWQEQLEATASIAQDDALANAGIFAALGPHATDTVSADLFERALEVATQHELPLHFHLAQSVEEYRRAEQRHGVSPTRWLSQIGVLERAPATVLAHGIYTSEDDLQLLTNERHALVFCPYSQLIFGFPAAVDTWQRAGLRWVVATDCASNNDTMNVQRELRLVAGQRTVGTTWSAPFRAFVASGGVAKAEAAWRARGALCDAMAEVAEPKALLDRVWGTAGKLHPGVRVGAIEPGALANLAIFDTEHPALWPCRDALASLALSDASSALWGMWVAGKQIGEDGALHRSIVGSDAYQQARHEADERLRALVPNG